MAFDLIIQTAAQYKSIQLIDTISNTIVTIQSKGALMNSWKVDHNQQQCELILGNPSNQFDNANAENGLSFEMNGFRSGKMSPFSCRIDHGQYHWKDQSYQFSKFYLGAHAMHGLVYDANFEIRTTTIDKHYATVELVYDYLGTDPGFPFPYEIMVQWTLYPAQLIQAKTTIKNKSNQSIPLMDGWHPYFTLGGQVNDYSLELNATGKIELNDALIPTGKIMEEQSFELGRRIGEAHFDDCYLLALSKNKVILSYQGKSIIVHPIHNYPYLQLYTPDDRKSIAIENLSGAPNCFNNKMGLQILEPQDQIYFETNYQFKETSN